MHCSIQSCNQKGTQLIVYLKPDERPEKIVYVLKTWPASN